MSDVGGCSGRFTATRVTTLWASGRSRVSVVDLQELFGVSGGNPMYDSFAVTQAQVEPLSRATGASIDLERYDYFVDADAV
jgi:hypothetical protein